MRRSLAGTASRYLTAVVLSAMSTGTALAQNRPPQPATKVTVVNDLVGGNDRTLSQAFTYDRRGNRVGALVSIDVGSDGSINRTESTVSTYDSHGNLLLRVTEIDLDPGAATGPEERRTTTLTYDNKGNLLTRINDLHRISDGTHIAREFSTFTYDNHGSVLTQHTENDGGPTVDGTIERTLDVTRVLDQHGFPVEVTSVQDHVNPALDRLVVTTIVRDGSGLPLVSTTVVDEGHDGSVDQVQTSIPEFQGRDVQHQVVTIDLAPLAAPDRVFHQTFLYNQQNRPAGRVTDVDLGADGTIELTLSDITTRNTRGDVVMSVNENDTDNDGILDQIITDTFTY